MDQEPTTGVCLIGRERARQVAVEGWAAEHDAQYVHGELSVAAACYAVAGTDATVRGGPENGRDEDAWPWSEARDKRKKHDRLRRLAIAGALIAAEIDRELRAQSPISNP